MTVERPDAPPFTILFGTKNTLMANAVIKLSKQVKFSPLYLLLTAAAFVLAVFTQMDTILILLTAGIIGVFHALWKKNSQKEVR